MATVSRGIIVEPTAQICQGDIFKDVKYTYISAVYDDTVEVVEYTFPMAIIISQACDVDSMSRLVDMKSGKVNKFMPSILLCPIYDKEEAKKMTHIDDAFTELKLSKIVEKDKPLFTSKEFDVVTNDWHYRFHSLRIVEEKKGNTLLENVIIDFKHYFTVPAAYLYANRNNRFCHLDSLFAEQVTLKFATFLSRVAIP